MTRTTLRELLAHRDAMFLPLPVVPRLASLLNAHQRFRGIRRAKRRLARPCRFPLTVEQREHLSQRARGRRVSPETIARAIETKRRNGTTLAVRGTLSGKADDRGSDFAILRMSVGVTQSSHATRTVAETVAASAANMRRS